MISTFPLNPLAHSLKRVVLGSLVVFSGHAGAVAVTGPVTIDASNPLVSYELDATGDLTANGASTLQITTTTGSQLTLNGTSVSGGTSIGIDLIGSEATITGSNVTSNTTGLNVGHRVVDGIGSKALVTDSNISGGNNGGLVSFFSELILQGTDVTGTNAGSRGLEIFSGKVSATASTITGQQNGVRLRAEAATTSPGTLTLDSTHVEGITGSAIVVGVDPSLPVTANIAVNNGSTLVGGNGTLLEVNASSTANMTVDNSHLVGDVAVEAGSTANLTLQNQATLTGRLENVDSLAVNSQAQWAMVGDGQVNNLSLNGGSVKFGDGATFNTLTVGNLSGSGTFLMNVDFSQAQSDFLNVTGNATGSHSLLIASTGTDPVADTSLHVVHAAAGDASFALVGGAVDLGTFSYDLVKQGNNDWFLDASSQTISPGAESVIALFNATPTVWYGELTSLRTRMGELRLNGGNSGVWMRTYGNKYNIDDSAGFGYQQTQHGLSLGADGKLPIGDGQWLAGVMAGQSQSDLSLDRGTSGKVDSYYVGAYSTWLDAETGYYFDGVLKFNRFQNSSRVNLSDGTRTKGDYDTSGVGTSLEFGRHIKLDNNYFVEPFTQLSGLIVEGKDYQLTNGMRADGDAARSLLGKVGATAGRNFDWGQGRTVQPYVRAAVAHEFVNNNKVQVNDNSFNNDLSGSRGEVGTGIAVSFAEDFQVHADFEYSDGKRVDQPWGANVGLRYNW